MHVSKLYHPRILRVQAIALGAVLFATLAWTPMAAAVPCFVDDFTLDFNAGTHAGTLTGEADDGEVILQYTEGSEFFGATLPAGWAIINDWTGFGTATVSGGAITVEQANVGPATLYGFGRSIEFVATFVAGEKNQHVGFGTNFSSTPWAIFSTGSAGSQLQARTWDGAGPFSNIDLGAAFLGVSHRYRIDWNTDNTVDFYIDGALVSTQAVVIATNMAPRISDINVGPSLVVDWIRMSPYAAAGSFQSRVYDGGSTTTAWGAVTWTSTEPAGTTLGISVRTGPTPVPDGSWTTYAAIATNGDPVGASAQFIQYRADLTTSDDYETPVLEDLTIDCTPGPDDSAPFVLSTNPANGAVGVSPDGNITIVYNEALNTGTFAATISGGVLHATAFQAGDTEVVLDPTLPLDGLTVYTVTIAPGVADPTGNATTAPHVFSFTTGPSTCVLETTIADFSDGTFLNTETAGTGDGSVILTSAGPSVVLNDPFTEPDGPASNWTPIDGTWNIVSNEYDFVHPNNYAASLITGASVTDFVIEARQKIVSFSGIGAGGFVWRVQNPTGPNNWKNGAYMLQWDTRAGTLQNVRVFRWNNTTSLTLLGGADIADVVLGTWYTLRVEGNGSNFDIYVDNVLVLQVSDATYASGAIGLVGWWQGDTRYDDVLLTVASGGFDPNGTYTSNGLDAGIIKNWLKLSSVLLLPATTGVTFETRTGPDGAIWSAWDPVAVDGTIASPDGRWIQYRASLSTGNIAVSPEVEQVLITCSPIDAPTPVLASLVSADALPDRVRLVWHLGGDRVDNVAVERRSEVGGWVTIGTATVNGVGRALYEDTDVVAGRYGYRLRFQSDGADVVAAEAWVHVPAQAFALDGVRPNPAIGGRLNVHFVLPTRQAARIELIDVAGRIVTSREVGSLGAGRHAVELGARNRLSPGVYMVRLTQLNRSATVRAVVIE